MQSEEDFREFKAGLREALGVETDSEFCELAIRDMIHESWTRHLVAVMNLVYIDGGDKGVAMTRFADSEDPGRVFFDSAVFLSRFESEGLDDLARWWLAHPDRRQVDGEVRERGVA